MKLPRALVVSRAAADLTSRLAVLRETSCDAIGTTDFREAQRLLDANQPDLLIADVRLGQFNGLHLTISSRFRNPFSRAILLDTTHDHVLEAETQRYGAAYLVNPAPSEPQATVERMLLPAILLSPKPMAKDSKNSSRVRVGLLR